MDLVHRHGHNPWPRRETVYHEECIETAVLFALQLLFSRFISFRVIASFFAHPPLLVNLYSNLFSPGLYRIDMGVFLALWQWA